jgi:hypothetical protein
MRRSIAVLGIVASLLLGIGFTNAEEAEKSSEGPADATIRLSGGSVAAGVGVSWGGGTLTFKGEDHPISVNGLTVGSVGAARMTATGNVHNLKRLEDFNGTYTAVSAGAAVGGGGGALTMRNQNGVVVNLLSTTQGVKFSVAASGVSMNLRQ